MKYTHSNLTLALALVSNLVTAVPRRESNSALGVNSTTATLSSATAESSIAASSASSNPNSLGSQVTTGKLDFGRCSNPGIVFGSGFDGRKEDSFKPADSTQFTHGSAQKINVITGFICDRFKDNCKASAEAQAACKAAEADTKGLTGQKAADAWNNALSVAGTTDLSGASTDSNTAITSTASATALTALSETASATSSSSSTATTSTSTATTAAPGEGLDLGSCSNPAIKFGAGFDGRTKPSFEPANKRDFNHGSADNIGVVTSFICQQLPDKCKANKVALALCSKASSAAAKQTGQAAADAFNNVFSVASQPPRKSGSAIAAASDSSQGAVTSSDSGGSAATATSSADSSASTSTGDGRKPNGVRKGQDGGKNRGNGGSDGNKGSSSTGDPALSLLAANVQSASDTTGIQGQGSEKAQAASATDPANFINFCTGKTLTNGLQVKSGSCNGIVMGDIPSTAKMVSQIITFPENGKTSNLKAKQTFKIKVQTNNLEAGSFTNPDNTYYAAPQQLKNGNIVGHTHVTVQDLGRSLTPKQPLDPSKFVFFKGINDAGDGKGGLSATVTGGLPAGNYRVCTLGSSSNHQPFLMPVAQRGAQDDCQKFVVE